MRRRRIVPQRRREAAEARSATRAKRPRREAPQARSAAGLSERAKRATTEANGPSAAKVVSAHPGYIPVFDHRKGQATVKYIYICIYIYMSS